MKSGCTILMAAALALAGCAAPYQEPAGPGTAAITFAATSNERMSVHFYQGPAQCTDRTSVGLVDARSPRTVRVAAGKPLVVTAGMDAGGAGQAALAVGGAVGAVALAPRYKGCTPTLEFTPEPGAAYTLRMGSDGRDCSYSFEQVQGGRSEPAPHRLRRWFRAAVGSGQHTGSPKE